VRTNEDPIRVLHVDDDPELAAAVGVFMEKEDDRLEVEPATSASEGLERLAADEFNCIVSDYDMPGRNGIEFLEAVREEYPDFPFILYTGKGSEEVASEAISAGVTDYLQKKGGTEQYELLANRIVTSVDGHLAQQEADWQETIIRNMGEGVYVFDGDHTLQYVKFRVSDIDKTSESNWIGRHISYFETTDLLSPDETDRIKDGIDRILDTRSDEIRVEIEPLLPESVDVLSLRLTPVRTREDEDLVLATSRDVTESKEREQDLQELKRQYETVAEHFPDGAVYLINADLEYVRARGKELQDVGLCSDQIEGMKPHDVFPDEIADELCQQYERAFEGDAYTLEQTYQGQRYRIQLAPVRTEDGEIDRIIAVSQNITESARKKERLERQNERLEEFTNVVSHDLRNPLEVAETRVELAERECDSEHLDHAARALDRMERLIENLLALAQDGESVGEMAAVALPALAETCWQAVETAEATLVTETEATIQADRERCRQLLENLLRSAVEHGSRDVIITVGALDEPVGFYVADDGPGVPTDERDVVFESGYSTTRDGSGFGLAIVREIAQAHGWTIDVTESRHGGARFEITGVEMIE
jgi:signal transduction histidine kinase/FixJ family two-component response regulator